MKISSLLVVLTVLYCIDAKTIYSPDEESIHYHPRVHNRKHLAKPKVPSEEQNATFWLNKSKVTLAERLQRTTNKNTAKNIILFIGDGMSITTLAAARTHLGQRNNRPGEETFLSFEKFPYTGLSKTYCVDSQVADSACSSIAYLCGVKGNDGTIGVSAAVEPDDCSAMNNKENHVYSLSYLAQSAGKRTGTVTTTRITHASPAGTYAHTANRDWESDTDVEEDDEDPQKCIDIAQQLIYGETGKNLNVIFGGGRSNFLPNSIRDEDGHRGSRNDDRHLINEWSNLKKETKHKYIHNLTELQNLALDTEYVLGLFNSDHLDYNLERDTLKQPSLQEMTEKAIKLLSQSEQGYFLFVEGGRIDHAHHSTKARKALDETIELHKAVEAAAKMTNEEDTLIVVTSDHSHTMTLNGYPERGVDVLGIGGKGKDKLPYTTLSYANGVKGIVGSRPDISNDDFGDIDYKYPSLVLLSKETHAGEDVAIFAKGPWAHLFTGVTEQNAIPYIISYASCIGEFIECEGRS
ncbi:hypothetical protein FQR65_LT03305 [Abscondita terminalis]|nr:hypothetical protein FQR65_LT03305 [Abscondita terminalis]